MPAPTEPVAGEGRRARVRRQTAAQLQAAALEEVREHGAMALSLRRVARRMGMSPAGLYRYVASRDALLTWLIADAYDDLADHLLTALGAPAEVLGDRQRPDPRVPRVVGEDADVADRLRAVALAYRAWSVTHPNEFALVFGDPIPGYRAPTDGPTTAAMTRVGQALGQPLAEAWRSGRLAPVEDELDPATRDGLAPMAAIADPPLPAAVSATLLLAWGRLHGQVSLEVFGHHAWLFPDGCEGLFRADVEAMLHDLGVVPGAP